MSNLVGDVVVPLKYKLGQGLLSASLRQTPCDILLDTTVMGHIILLISLLKHHLAMQRNSAQNDHALCYTLEEKTCCAEIGKSGSMRQPYLNPYFQASQLSKE